METFKGKIKTVNDAMIIFEACRQGILRKTMRRLLEKEKEELRSGQVYVFDETESSIKRWTDGRLWAPGRIIKDFLVYRELAILDRSVKRDEPIDEFLQKRVQPEELKVFQCSKGTFVLRNNGLLKKTISIKFNGTYQQMIIYEDGSENGDDLLPPEAFEELRHIRPGEDIIKSEKMPKINRNSEKKKKKKKKKLLKHLVMDHQDYPNDKLLLWNRDQDENSDGLSDVQDEREYAATNNQIVSAQPHRLPSVVQH